MARNRYLTLLRLTFRSLNWFEIFLILSIMTLAVISWVIKGNYSFNGIIAGISAILCMLLGEPSANALTGSLASLSNVGPSLGSIGSMGNYNAEPGALKFIFSVDMFLGRVEIYPVFAVLSSIFPSKY